MSYLHIRAMKYEHITSLHSTIPVIYATKSKGTDRVLAKNGIVLRVSEWPDDVIVTVAWSQLTLNFFQHMHGNGTKKPRCCRVEIRRLCKEKSGNMLVMVQSIEIHDLRLTIVW